MSSLPVGGNIVGIELGVTHSYAGHLSASGEPVLLHNSENEISTRSAIWFEGSGKVVVGTEAWRMRGLNDHVFVEFLRDIGQGLTYPTPDGPFSPSDFCALMLKKLSAESMDHRGEVAVVAITVPANLTDWARQDIRRAAVMAGLRNFRLVDTATALALSAHRQHDLKDGKYLVVSSGISSTDALVFEVIGDDIRVLHSSGVSQLGFKDFTEKFASLVNQKYEQLTGIKSSNQDMITSCQLTRFALDEGIKTLSNLEKVTILLRSDQGVLRCEVSREEFEAAVKPLTVQIELLVEFVLDYSRISASQLSGVFLQSEPEICAHLIETLKSLTSKSPIEIPQGSAALGATIYAALSAGIKRLTNAQKVGIRPIRIQDLAPSFLGMIEIDWLTGKRRNRVIIPKGEPLPAYRSYALTADDSGRLPVITLTESSSEQSDLDFVIHIRTLTESRARPGSRHALTIGFDQNGCAYVTLESQDDGGDGEASGFMELPPRRS
jgi:molecular chaperone DnaK (HSP70)